MTWAQLPLLRLSIPFVAGIVASYFWSWYVSTDTVIGVLIGITVSVFISVITALKARIVLVGSGFLPLIASFICGFILMHVSKTDEQSITRFTAAYYLAEVRTESLKKGKWNRSMVAIKGKVKGTSVEVLKANIMLYLPSVKDLSDGDMLLIHVRTVPQKKVPNPGEFNYSEYLKKQNVFTTIFISDTGDVKILKKAEGILPVINKWRNNLIVKIRITSLQPDTKALLMSLVLGAAEDLDPSLRSSFSASGTMHVLSVSGMHIALLYMLFVRLFAFIRMHKRISYMLIIILVWLYAGLTGFSPSVLRAAVICSFMVLGEATSRISNSMNLLAASAMLLLSFDPFLVFNPGFQLSYTAVGGIILFQRKLNEMVTVEGRVAKEVLNAVTVTLAAQIGTIGVSLFYFGQFPLYFLFANLVIVPLSSVLLYVGIGYILLLIISAPPSFIDFTIDLLFELFTVTVNYFGSLPGAILNIKFDLFFVVMIYSFLLAIYYYSSEKWRIAFLSSVMIFTGSLYIVIRATFLYQSQLIIYDSKEPMIGVLDRSGIFKWKVDSLVDSCSNRHLYRDGVFSADGKTILLAGVAHRKVASDILLVTRHCKTRNEDLLKLYTFEEIVVTNGVSRKRLKDLTKRCSEKGIKVWSTSEQGARIITTE